MASILRLAAGGTSVIELDALLAGLDRARGGTSICFAPERLALVAGLSRDIRGSAEARASPAVTHFAFWTRQAALAAMARAWRERLPGGCVARPLGLVFHLPPQNVETVFLYSWVISYLLGNDNIVRLPTAADAAMSALLDRILAALEAAGETGQIFLRYAVADRITGEISASSDGRIVWGGDAKIAALAPMPLRRGGKALWFGDRRSFAAIDARALAAVDRAGLDALAERLCRDIYPFDQLACASPQTLYLVGAADDAADRALGRLFDRIAELALDRGLLPPAGHRVRKLVAASHLAATGAAVRVREHGGGLTVTELSSALEPDPVGGGFLALIRIGRLEDVSANIIERHQTMTHWGFGGAAIRAFADRLPAHGVRRIVPVGEALAFDALWDGYDLTRELVQLCRVAAPSAETRA